jgi:hypothetical protein
VLLGLGLGIPADAATQAHETDALILLFLIALIGLGTYAALEIARERRAPAERAQLIADIRTEFIETLKAFPPGTLGAESALLGSDVKPSQGASGAPKASALWNRAETAVANLPTPTSLRQQAFDIVTAGKDNLRQYHGKLDADEWVNPEFIRAWVPLHFPLKDKLELVLKRWILRAESKLPMTVNRMVMWLDDVEKAALDVPSDIPPVEAEQQQP